MFANVKKLFSSTNVADTTIAPEIQWDETVPFTFPITGGQVIKVYDADTITIASKLPYDASPLYRLSVRLNGIDTPEIKGKGVSDEEKEAAILARDFVSNLVLHTHVRLEISKAKSMDASWRTFI